MSSMFKLIDGELKKGVSAVAVIMAGGSGTRFWPLSREARPKQFLPLAGGERSLIKATSERVASLIGDGATMVVTAESQAHLVREHLPSACILSEPVGRNTAPCLGYAALLVMKQVGDVAMLCLPSDHVIGNVANVLSAYEEGIKIANENDVLVTFGIKPSAPETGYGYILRGEANEKLSGAVHNVEKFVEKPDLLTAEKYMQRGDYFWNSGMFVWRPSVLLKAIEKCLPDLYEKLLQIQESLFNDGNYEVTCQLYSSIKPISIDFGVLEKTDNVVLITGSDFLWSDVGSWSSWVAMISSEENCAGNLIKGDALLLDSKGCTIVSDDKFVAGVGLSDLIIVSTSDATLVCHKSKSQDVKKIVDELKLEKRTELL